jgi:hypothetical protein
MQKRQSPLAKNTFSTLNARITGGFFVSTVETGNDLYKTVVRLQLILFSKDIGAF